jgi:hypothetical protein
MGAEMANLLEESDWDILLGRIKAGKCTPFLGAGACHGVLPLGGAIADRWAREHGYPLRDSHDLARVAQFLAVRKDPMYPKEEILNQFIRGTNSPDFKEIDEPHGVLAELPIPVYMTTNYDDFMMQALKARGKRPQRELCRWNHYVKEQPTLFKPRSGFTPSPETPVVFHLHGHDEVSESLVLTEDDYLDFLVNISKDAALIPPVIQRALTGSTLLFIGYSLADWTFRVLFRGLIAATEKSLRRLNVTVQLPPPAAEDGPADVQDRIRDYLGAYFDSIDMRVCWGTARDFARELRARWREFSHGR